MVLLLLTFCLLLLPLWESVIVLCFVVRYFMSILVLQSSWWGRESWLLRSICLPGVSWWLSGSSSGCHGVVFSLWLWYFLIILTYYFCLLGILFFFKINFLAKILSDIQLECGSDWIQIRPNVFSAWSGSILFARLSAADTDRHELKLCSDWYMNRDMRFPTKWHFDKCRLGPASAASL